MDGDGSDEDYMSDKVKPLCSGLLSKGARQRIGERRMQAPHISRKGKQMDVSREEGLKRRIGEDNIGYKLMLKMGFRGDGGIGKKAEGRSEPIPIEIIDGRKGLGLHNIEKKRAEAIAAAKKQRDMEMSVFQSDFRASMASRFRMERAQRQLMAARSICQRLDLAQSLDQPINEDFWPPDENRAKLLAHSELIRREICRSSPCCVRKKKRRRRNDVDGMKDFGERRDEYDTVLGVESDEEEYCDIDAAQHGPIESQPDMILSRLCTYLRESHFYCFWCGEQYSSRSNLEANCPGSTEEDHGYASVMKSTEKDAEASASEKWPTPESADDLNVVGRFFFRWVDPVLKLMDTRPLEPSDVPRTVQSHKSERYREIVWAFLLLHYIWLVPIQASAVVWLVHREGGLPAALGALTVIVLTFLQIINSLNVARVRKYVLKLTDARVGQLQELIGGIQLLKMFNWEPFFTKAVQAIRRERKKDPSKGAALESVNFKLEGWKLVAIVGSVESGKSSFVQAILDELPPSAGSIHPSASVAYLSQIPWVFAGTIRENILCGQPLNKDRYALAIRVSALEADLAKFLDGDETEAGEHRLTLSGGQKARVLLARAAYTSAAAVALVILDDPLASIDPGVSAQIFTNCLRNHMHNRLCLFITNHPYLLSQCDLIVVLREGPLETLGTYDQNGEKAIEVSLNDSNLVTAGGKIERNLSAYPADIDNVQDEEVEEPQEGEEGNHLAGTNLPFVIEEEKKAEVEVAEGQSILRMEADIPRALMSHRFRHQRRRTSTSTSTITTPSQPSSLLSWDSSLYQTSSIQFDDGSTGGLNDAIVCRRTTAGQPKLRKTIETRQQGHVKFQNYLAYFMDGAGWLGCVEVVLFYLVAVTAAVAFDLIVAHWRVFIFPPQCLGRPQNLLLIRRLMLLLQEFPTELANAACYKMNAPEADNASFPVGSESYFNTKNKYLAITGSLQILVIMLSFNRYLTLFAVLTNASRRLHDAMLRAVMATRMEFFHFPTAGQIINRFSKDTGQVDDIMAPAVAECLSPTARYWAT
ncbi:Cystic fibrosi transmembrane conductance regulator [Taenia crassiceps]|uniref:G patch domain-containing protein 11 n=1 Tax=Taenia crassiceps TaxID=6207 RepID=A0ABR4QI41_9CEST